MKSSKIERLFVFVCALVMAVGLFGFSTPVLAEEAPEPEATTNVEAEATEAYTITFTGNNKTETVEADALSYEMDAKAQLKLINKLYGTTYGDNDSVKAGIVNEDDKAFIDVNEEKLLVKDIFAANKEIKFSVTKSGQQDSTNYAVTVICQKNITNDMIKTPEPSVYDGKEKTITVKDGETELKEGTDYTVKYQDNTNAGTAKYTVTGKGNYIGTVNGEFTIDQATITVTAENKTKTEGDADPELTYTATGFVDPDTAETVLEGKLARESGETAGAYDILQGTVKIKDDKPNYKIEYKAGKLLITKKTTPTTTCTIKFDGNPGENPTKGEEVTGEMGPQTVTPNVATKLAENAFKRSHFDFVGWNTAADGSGTAYADMAEITTDTDVTLYAQWKRQVFAITFDANGGSGTMDKQTMECSIATKLNENKYSRDGYTFKAWNTKADGTGLSFKNKETVRITKDITLYAQWTKKGSSSGSSSSKTSGSSSSSSSTSSNATLAKTADPTSLVAVATMAGAGVAAVAAGTRKKRG